MIAQLKEPETGKEYMVHQVDAIIVSTSRNGDVKLILNYRDGTAETVFAEAVVTVLDERFGGMQQ